MQTNLEDQAIKASLEGKWQEAVNLNQQILVDDPHNIPALNRLAKAYAQLGNTAEALQKYESVLQLDRFNAIAQKQCVVLKSNPCGASKHCTTILTEFIEEPGKTKTTALVRLGDSKVLSSLQPGQVVMMTVKNHWIAISTQSNEYIGALADNLSFKIKQFIAGGNEYQTIVQSAAHNQVSVFIKEMKRAPTFVNTPSF